MGENPIPLSQIFSGPLTQDPSQVRPSNDALSKSRDSGSQNSFSGGSGPTVKNGHTNEGKDIPDHGNVDSSLSSQLIQSSGTQSSQNDGETITNGIGAAAKRSSRTGKDSLANLRNHPPVRKALLVDSHSSGKAKGGSNSGVRCSSTFKALSSEHALSSSSSLVSSNLLTSSTSNPSVVSVKTPLLNGKKVLNSYSTPKIRKVASDFFNIPAGGVDRLDKKLPPVLSSSSTKLSNSSGDKIRSLQLDLQHEQQHHQIGNEQRPVDDSDDQTQDETGHEQDGYEEDELQNYERQFLHLNRDLRICELPPNMFGIFVIVKPSMKFIPSDCENLIRKVYIKIMREIQNATLNSPAAILAWKRFWLLPLVLFTHSNEKGNVRSQIRTSAKKIMVGDWESFTLGSLVKRQKPVVQSSSAKLESKEHQITQLLSIGQVSRAYAVLKSDNKGMIVMNDERKVELKLLYPPRIIDHGIDPQTLRQIREYRGHIRQDDFREASMEMISKILMSKPKGISGGLDQSRFEHMQKMWGFSDHPDQTEFKILYTYIINKIMYAEVPMVLRSLWADTATSVLRKADNRMRPLGKLDVHRKIAASALWRLNKGTIEEVFGNLQLGTQTLGAEKILHMLSITSELHPDLCQFFPDGKNAFNNISRDHAMKGIMEYCPELAPFFLLIYGDSSKTWALDELNDVFSVGMHEGAQQGCTLGSLLCGIATLPMVKALQGLITDRGKAMFFCDDGNLMAPFPNMIACMEYLIEEGPKYGYIMHMNEGACLLSKCGSMSLALLRKQEVLDLGFDTSMVKIHPDDMEVNDLQGNGNIDDDLLHYELSMTMDQRVTECGASVLGNFIGTDEFVHASLIKKLEKIQIEAKILSEHTNAQQALLFLRLCFTPKFDYILRTMPTFHTRFATSEISAMKRSILNAILGSEHGITDSQFTQAQLSLHDGGLALRFANIIRHCGSIASKIESISSLSDGESNILELLDLNIPWVRSLHFSMDFISKLASSDDNKITLTYESIREIERKTNDGGADAKTLQSKLSNMVTKAYSKRFKESIDSPSALAVFVSVSDPEGGAQSFLSAIPTSPTKTFHDSAFKILVNRYLNIPLAALEGPPVMCDCFKSVKDGIHARIDSRGDHCVCCPRTGFGINNHNAALLVIQQIAQAAGKTAKREPVNVFAAVRRNPTIAAKFTEKQLTSRPDLLIQNLTGPNPKVLLDVTITTPNPSGVTLAQARIPQRASTMRYNEKNMKYLDISKACRLGFHPIVFETTGRMHSSSLTFIRSLLKNISGGFRDGTLLRRFWLEKLMCTVHQQIANSILDKINLQCGQRFIIGNYENRPDPNLEISLGRFV